MDLTPGAFTLQALRDKSSAEGDRPDGACATLEQVRHELHLLVSVPIRLKRLCAIARQLSWGSDLYWHNPDDLVQAALHTALEAASARARGEATGRAWTTDVPFHAYVVMTMRGLASDARVSGSSRLLVRTGDMHEACDVHTPLEDLLGEERHRTALTILQEVTRDGEIRIVIEGRLAGMSAEAIRERAGMSLTQYHSVLKRLSRKLEKLRSQEHH